MRSDNLAFRTSGEEILVRFFNVVRLAGKTQDDEFFGASFHYSSSLELLRGETGSCCSVGGMVLMKAVRASAGYESCGASGEKE